MQKINRQKGELGRKKAKVKDKLEIIDSKIERMDKDLNSFGNTDQDATLMLMKEGNFGVEYNVQMTTENQVEVAFEAYQKPNDVHSLKPIIEKIEHNFKQKPEAIVTDKGCCSESNNEYVNQMEIKAVIPFQTYDYDMAARRKGTYKYSKNLD